MYTISFKDINGENTLLDKDGLPKLFGSLKAAENFLLRNGVKEEDLNFYDIV